MRHLPNILTLSNLFCGCLACILLVKNGEYLPLVIILICFSLIFDFFDGFAARLTKTGGEFGKQLDSLADMVTFGLFPGIVMVSMLGEFAPCYLSLARGNFLIPGEGMVDINILKYSGLLITLFSALRLAKFNIDEEQGYYFKGLPTPANTIFILSLLYIQKNYTFDFLNNFWVLLAVTLISSYLLVANVPLFSLKFQNFKWKDNSLVFSFLLICIVLFIVLKVIAIPLIIIVYIILSIIFRKKIISDGTETT